MYGHMDQPGKVPVLLVVSLTVKIHISRSAFAPENLASRDGFDSPVPCQPSHLHTQAIYVCVCVRPQKKLALSSSLYATRITLPRGIADAYYQ